jgi:hypothetical protein
MGAVGEQEQNASICILLFTLYSQPIAGAQPVLVHGSARMKHASRWLAPGREAKEAL